VLVRAEGDNFSAGANVEMFLDRDEVAARELIAEFMPAIRRFAEIEVPTVAPVQGLCLAAGLEARTRSAARQRLREVRATNPRAA
jgi:enoyl-CoA hydratase/carnithine racemase